MQDNKSKYKSFLTSLRKRFFNKTSNEIQIEAALSFAEENIKNWALYRSQPSELISVFNNLKTTYPNSFWSNASQTDTIVPRTLGLPKSMVDKMVEICSNAIHEINIENAEYQKIWEEIEKEIDLKEDILIPSIKGAEVAGDICAVVCADGERVAPFVKIYYGDEFQPIYKNKKYQGAIVYDIYIKKENNVTKAYLLETTYTYGAISYKLFNDEGEEVALTEIEETKDLVDLTHDKRICLATTLFFKKSTTFENRGESIYHGRETNFDALDENYSIWQSTPSINSSKVFNGEKGDRDRFGNIVKRNRLMNLFRQMGDINDQFTSDKNRGQLEIYNPTWSVENFVETHYTNIEECLKEYISPSTLSYNVQKFSVQTNASYNAQIEKATSQTRNSRLDKLTNFIIDIIKNSIYMYLSQVGRNMKDFKINIDYCEFETPSVEQKTEVFAKQVASGLCSRKYAIACINPDLEEDEVERIYQEYLQEQKDLANLVDYGEEETFEDEKEEQVNVDEEKEKEVE